MKALKSVEVPAPVHIGDVLVKDVAGTGCGYCGDEKCRIYIKFTNRYKIHNGYEIYKICENLL